MIPDRSNNHESRGLKCACCDNCMFFFADQNLGGIDDVHECRRFPPSIVLWEGTIDEAYAHPLVKWNHWCGEWKSAT